MSLFRGPFHDVISTAFANRHISLTFLLRCFYGFSKGIISGVLYNFSTVFLEDISLKFYDVISTALILRHFHGVLIYVIYTVFLRRYSYDIFQCHYLYHVVFQTFFLRRFYDVISSIFPDAIFLKPFPVELFLQRLGGVFPLQFYDVFTT